MLPTLPRGAEAAAAGPAAVVGARQTQGPERALERLDVPAAVAGGLATRARHGRPAVVWCCAPRCRADVGCYIGSRYNVNRDTVIPGPRYWRHL